MAISDSPSSFASVILNLNMIHYVEICRTIKILHNVGSNVCLKWPLNPQRWNELLPYQRLLLSTLVSFYFLSVKCYYLHNFFLQRHFLLQPYPLLSHPPHALTILVDHMLCIDSLLTSMLGREFTAIDFLCYGLKDFFGFVTFILFIKIAFEIMWLSLFSLY